MKLMIALFLLFWVILFSGTAGASPNMEYLKGYALYCKHVGGTPMITKQGYLVCLFESEDKCMSLNARDAGRAAKSAGLSAIDNPYLWGSKAFHLWSIGFDEQLPTVPGPIIELFQQRGIDPKYLAAHLAGTHRLSVAGGKVLMSDQRALCEVSGNELELLKAYLTK